MFASAPISVCRFDCPVYTHPFLEMFNIRPKIVEQRFLSVSHTQQQAFDLLGRYPFANGRLLAVDTDSRSPQLVQPTVDFDGLGAFAFGTS